MLTLLQITERSQVAEARRLVSTEAFAIDFDEEGAGKLALVVTEAGTNLLKHAGGGSIIIRSLVSNGVEGIEILALDKGPGMADLSACMRDGYSTGGSPGTGLGAIARVSDEFDIYTLPGQGTVLMARFWKSAPPTPPSNGSSRLSKRLSIEALSVPMPGEEVCGDGWWSEHAAGRAQILVADGLGHGPMAAAAAMAAQAMFRENIGRPPSTIVELMHGALRSTRGAAASITEVDLEERCVRHCGVGNIAGAVVIDQKVHRMISHNGTLGHEVRKVQEFTYPWMPGALLLLHSDGLGTQWDLGNYPGLLKKHLSVIAAVLFRDYTRGRDDATVVVAREEEEDS